MKVLVIGASEKPERYSNIAINMLREYEHEVVALGLKAGKVADVAIETGKPSLEGIHTVTLYVSAKNQLEWYDYIISLKPSRIIFNPGTENILFEERASNAGIEVVEGCTLVMLRSNTF